MNFDKYLKIYMGNGDFLKELTKFKKEDPERYAKYNSRVKTVEQFHLDNANREGGTFRKPLTVDTFYTTEKYYNAICKLRGAEPTDMTE